MRKIYIPKQSSSEQQNGYKNKTNTVSFQENCSLTNLSIKPGPEQPLAVAIRLLCENI